MWQKPLIFLAGVVVSPFLKPILRPIARQAVKGGIIMNKGIHKLVTEAREELDDLRAEAQEELRQTSREPRLN